MGTLFDDSSLVMIPSGVKDGKLYSIRPTDGSGDFTFSRGSNLAATRVDVNGLIEKGRENLLLQSNQFDTTWLNQLGGTITGGQAGYDGTNDAWLISKSASNYKSLRQVVSYSGVSTFSVYAKSGTLSSAGLRLDTGAGTIQILYDLTDGSVTLTSGLGIIEAGSDDIGGGWYRIYVTANVSSGTNVHIYPDRNGTTAGNIYIQDAQLEQSLVARTYIDTTTAAVYAGITDNLPRLDYSGGASCPSLLLEPQRTNLFTQSEYFSAWSTIQNATITDNDLSSPEGLQNAAKITDNATSGNHRVFQSVTTTAASYTFSIFLKKGTMTTAFLFFNSGGTAASANVDLDAGTITATAGSATIEAYESDWYRCSITGTAVAGTSYLYVYMKQLSGYSGSGQDMYLYGAQVEAGSYATSYIPTYGSSVSRVADVTSLTSAADLIGQTEGTIYSEVRFHEGGNASNWLSISSGNPQNWVFIGKDGDDIRGYVRASNSVIFSNQTFQIVDNAIAKVAIAYKSNDVVLYINGTQMSSTTNSLTFDATLDSVYFGSHDNGITFETRKQNQVMLFKTRLSNEELADLTTI